MMTRSVRGTSALTPTEARPLCLAGLEPDLGGFVSEQGLI